VARAATPPRQAQCDPAKVCGHRATP
jgi:hypothetical protein